MIGTTPGDAALVQRPLDLEQVVLGVVDQHQPVRREAADLAAQLRADGAAGTRDQHRAAGQVAADRGEVELHGRAAQHVLHLHRAQALEQVEVAVEQLVDARHRLDRHAAAAADVDDALADARLRARHGDHDLVRRRALEDLVEVGRLPLHAHALEPHALLAGVVVEQAGRRVAQRALLQHLAHHQLPGLAGADHQHLAPGRQQEAGARPLEDGAGQRARRDQREQREDEVERDDAARQGVDVGEQLQREHHQHARRDAGAHDVEQVAQRDVAPPARVQAEGDEDDDLDQDDAPQALVTDLLRPDRQLLEAEEEGRVPGERDQPRVDEDVGQPVPDRKGHKRRL